MKNSEGSSISPKLGQHKLPCDCCGEYVPISSIIEVETQQNVVMTALLCRRCANAMGYENGHANNN